MEAQDLADVSPKSPVFADDKLFQIYQRYFKRLTTDQNLFEVITNQEEREKMSEFYERSHDPMLQELPKPITDFMNFIESNGHSSTHQYPQPEFVAKMVSWATETLPKLQAIGPSVDTIKTLLQQEPIHKQWLDLENPTKANYSSTLIICTEVWLRDSQGRRIANPTKEQVVEYHRNAESTDLEQQLTNQNIILRLSGFPILGEFEGINHYLLKIGVAGFDYESGTKMSVWRLNSPIQNEESRREIYFAKKLEFGSALHLKLQKVLPRKSLDAKYCLEFPWFIIFTIDSQGEEWPVCSLVGASQVIFLGGNSRNGTSGSHIFLIDKSQANRNDDLALCLISLDDPRLDSLKTHDGLEILKEGYIQFNLQLAKGYSNNMIGLIQVDRMQCSTDEFHEIESAFMFGKQVDGSTQLVACQTMSKMKQTNSGIFCETLMPHQMNNLSCKISKAGMVEKLEIGTQIKDNQKERKLIFALEP